MAAPTKGPRLGGGPAHESMMLRNMATSLFKHGKITTTETKAKRLRPYAEKLITFAKRGDLAARLPAEVRLGCVDHVRAAATEVRGVGTERRERALRTCTADARANVPWRKEHEQLALARRPRLCGHHRTDLVDDLCVGDTRRDLGRDVVGRCREAVICRKRRRVDHRAAHVQVVRRVPRAVGVLRRR